MPCFRGSPLLLHVFLFAFSLGLICFGAELQLWESHGLGTHVLESDLRSSFTLTADDCADRQVATLNFGFLFYQIGTLGALSPFIAGLLRDLGEIIEMKVLRTLESTIQVLTVAVLFT